jgi:hypothetical protein
MSDTEKSLIRIKEVKDNMTPTSITVSRILKDKQRGDIFISQTVNLESANSLKDSRIATHILGLEVNLLAYEQAQAMGLVSGDDFSKIVSEVKKRMSKLIVEKGK